MHAPKKTESVQLQEMNISSLAEFLNISLSDLDEMSEEEQAALLRQLIAISQMKLTRIALAI